MVGDRFAAHGGDDAQRRPRPATANTIEQRQLGRRRDELARSVRTGVVGLLGLAEVAVQQLAEVDAVLLRQRLVEPVALAERGDRRGILDRALAEVRGRRVAGDELGEQERDERDAESIRRTSAASRRATNRTNGRDGRSRPPRPRGSAVLAGADGGDVDRNCGL